MNCKETVKGVYTSFVHMLFPPLCCNCQNEGAYICKDCLKELYVYPGCCFFCRNKSSSYSTCSECVSILDKVIVSFTYSGAMRSAIKAIKYKDYTAVVPLIIEKTLLANPLDQFSPEDSVITYVPMHPRKQYWQRGYNQGALLAKELSKQSGIPISETCKKIKSTRSQTKFSRDKRKMNVYNTFTLSKKLSKGVKHVIIVDDIVTTGATLSTVAGQIKKHHDQPLEIIGYCLARH